MSIEPRPMSELELPAVSSAVPSEGGAVFSLGANAGRLESGLAEIRQQLEQARELGVQAELQQKALEQSLEEAREQALAACAQREQQVAQRAEADVHAQQRSLERWEQRLEQLRTRIRKETRAQAVPDATANEVDYAAFQAASKRFTDFARTLGIARDEIKLLDIALMRLDLQRPDDEPAAATKGEPDVALTAMRDQVRQLQERLAPQRRTSVRLRYHPSLPMLAAVIVIVIDLALLIAAWIGGLGPIPISIVGGVLAIVAIVVAVVLKKGIRQRQAMLADIARESAAVVEAISHLEREGKRQLDPKLHMAVGSILDAERARDQAAEQALERARASRKKALERVDALAQRLEKRRAQAQAAKDRALERGSSAVAAERERVEQAEVAAAAEARAQHQVQTQGQREAAAVAIAGSIEALDRELKNGMRSVRSGYRAWDDPVWQSWTCPETPPSAVPVARLSRDVAELMDELGVPAELARPIAAQGLELSADLVLPEAGLLLAQGSDGLALIHQAMLRLLLSSPPGKIRFTLLDPVGLGNNFAPFLRLRDADEHLIGPKVWTGQVEIERVLANLGQHAEKVIQKFLRDRYTTLADYNAAAGDLAEPYQVLVIADFPQGLSDMAQERLAGLVQHGPRCGIFCWAQAGAGQALPELIPRGEFASHGVLLQREPKGWMVPHATLRNWVCTPEPLPDAALFERLIDAVAEQTAACGTLALPLSAALPDASERWQRDSGRELRIPIGRSGADSIQDMVLGAGTAQHVLIGGRTGSGKSTLLHALITAGAWWFAPDQLEFYLIDFKKGVEFKIYATSRLPHARVVAVESDREFGLSVLRALDRELDERGKRFRAAGVQDLASYRSACPDDVVPRTMLVIDEFQELFVEDDAIAHSGAMLLDRFVRQGRAFGIHVVLGSQSLGGSSSLARSTIGQIGVRIALQCSEVDSQLILSDENTAGRLLERPGEAIYNDRSGLSEGNAPFQVFWLNDDEQRRLLDELPKDGQRAPRVFEGSAPALLGDNDELRGVIAGSVASAGLGCWVGEPNALGGPCRLQFGAGAAGNVVMVGHNREAGMGMAIAAVCACAASHGPDAVRIRIIDAEGVDDRASDYLRQLAEQLPHDVELIAPGEAAQRLTELSDSCVAGATPELPTVVLVLGLQRLRELRMADAFAFSGERGPGEAFADLLTNGPDAGIYSWVWCDSVGNLSRGLNRTAQRALGQRIVFQMSTGDSSDLIDDGSASHLGLHHGLLVDLAGGTRVKFRPYSPPESDVLEALISGIQQRWSAR
ncbi:MAG: FtsK/SpoIIIE domain-containing protein [Planctomycetota bacterium]|jgi:S-DNA-T family DNA segregation ATPase FtsK/SpoIIIE|nr:FtsK/SpoIIIE domain-containing protein [Planctomycetota bacterium]